MCDHASLYVLLKTFCASIADAIRCKSSVIVCKKLENKLY